MSTVTTQVVSKQNERLARFSKRVMFQRADGESDREAVYRLRYEAYRRQNLLSEENEGRLFDEKYDESPNGCSVMMLIDGELASTVRVHVGSQPCAILPSLAIFADVIMPHLQAGELIIDPTRLAADYEMSRNFPELPYFAMRPAWMAAQYFNADYVLATAVEAHAAFYRRTFGYQVWCGPRPYPALTVKGVCMGASFAAGRLAVEARYAVFKLADAECEDLFGGRPEMRRIAETSAGKAPAPSAPPRVVAL